MDTLGTLIDKLSIENIRLVHTKEEEKAVGVRLKVNELTKEIDTLITAVVKKVIPPPDGNKFKMYFDPIDNVPSFYGIADNINGLLEANINLWELEDQRRDKSLPDAERLEAADLVSTYNQKRNQHVEEIDRIFKEKVEKA